MTAPLSILKAPSLDNTVIQLGEHMPRGKLWESKSIKESNLNSLMRGMATPLNILQQNIENLANELNVNKTVALIGEWETSVGLPDDCTGVVTDLNQRRADVKERLGKQKIVNLVELQAYVDRKFTDFNVTLKTGVDVFTFEYTFEIQFLGDVSDKFIIVAEIPPQGEQFEYTFEYELTGTIDQTLLRCIIEKVIPVNVVLVIIEVPDVLTPLTTWDSGATTWDSGATIWDVV